ncbi:uncharacterized protein LOC106065158 isoform X3 [Biomphalaria glabrata]|uniref:Uncharacterized protein LOC106065158 isoform X3 n=1 Tax=Biomphalaria glabrata TaxID=6526 RepID=A0A9W2Z5D2_BIOGL|nr:uncharacterized protein LOC106065158 isoform X3 [Biomphalaria glabrata]
MLEVLAAQTLKIASMNGLGELDKLENELEDEINYENRSPAKTAFGRFRREGYHKLHSKMVLFIVVFLNVIDCLIVMAELILDFHNVSMKEEAKNDMLSNFMSLMMDKYNGSLGSLSKKTDESHVLLQHILNATVVFDYSYLPVNSTAELVTSCNSYLNKTQTTVVPNANQPSADQLGVCFGGVPYEKPFILEKDGRMSLSLIAVGHKLHYISIAILAVLVIVLGLKIICSGKRFFKSRMQVFDGIIVLISFILDLVFIEGLSSLNTNEFVMILTFLLPWRIIRVLNSLIVAVLDKQRLNLKIIYTQKKKITRTLAEVNNKVEVLQRHVEVLQNLCSSRGIGDYEVKRALGGDSSSTLKNGSSGGLASMMALGKLAFQAADAFAPMTNGYKKPEISASEPVLNTLDISPPDTPRPGGDRASDNNNQAPKNKPVGINVEPKVDTSEPYPEVTLEVPAENEKDIRLQTVTVHMNGSGPPKETSLNEDMRRTCSTTDLTDVQCYVNGNEIISKL